jgi:Tfp pilus assembly protein PilV
MGRYNKGLVSQRGASLIEAMISMLILAILFLGIAQVLGRSLVSQRYMNTYNLALLEMRERFQEKSESVLCTEPGSLHWVGNVKLVASCDESEVTIAVDGSSTSVKTKVITLSTSKDEASINFFGGDGVIRISEGSVVK